MQNTFEHVATLLQVTSHAHALLQRTLEHELAPAQSTLHGPVPHATPRHELSPVHETLHDSVPVQMTAGLPWVVLRHEFGVEHSTSQFQPCGHTIWVPTQLFTAQSIVQAFAATLQLEHCAGHAFASGCGLGASARDASTGVVPGATQKLSTHTRPSRQSLGPVQA